MKKLLLFVIVCLILSSCVISGNPMHNHYVRPVAVKKWWKPWGCPNPHNYHRKHYRHH